MINEGGSIKNLQRDLDMAMLESEWQKEVIAYAQAHDWLVAHCRPARTAKGWRTPMQGDPGFPDLCCARNSVVLLIELKRWGGYATREQMDWLEAGEGYCWTPEQRRFMEEVLA